LPSVRQWLDWKLLETLPKAGGTLDQDPLFMTELRFILNVEAREEKKKDEMEKIRQKIKEQTGRKK
jgi:hypothetical protein